MISTAEKPERLILVAAYSGSEEAAGHSLDELEGLVETAGGLVCGRLIQSRDYAHPVTYLGSGKLDELNELIYMLQADGIVTDDELSPVQIRSLEDICKVKIMDRTLVILDIFAKHAVTHEGKIQVELAQLKYMAARLTGLRSSLSRLGGGIGTRGPGEKKIEMDRRLIHGRIGALKDELRQIQQHRDVTRQNRTDSMLPLAAIVGYTNAGKSTLFNRITGADVLEQDQLFATLDATIRQADLPQGRSMLLSDTVGFINKLPHHLIEAFRSTLEETRYADIIIHVVDVSDPQMDLHMYVVYDTLRELEITGKPVITVFNKADLCPDAAMLRDTRADRIFTVSARTGQGIESLRSGILEVLKEQSQYVEKLFRYSELHKVQLIRQYGSLQSEEYTEDGVIVTGYIPRRIAGLLYE